MLKTTGVLLLLVSIAVLVLGLWRAYDHAVTAPVVLKYTRVIEIVKGDSFKTITHKLLAQKITISPLLFKLLAYQQQVSNELKAGEYELKIGLTMPQILALFVKGRPKQYAITFPEGWNFKQIMAEIQRNPHLKNTLLPHDFEAIMTQLDVSYPHPEGIFFPDTYFFDKNSSDLSLLKVAHLKMQQVLTAEWANRARDLPLNNVYEALILASIVEKETGDVAERPQIAGVFIRRLKKGMLLQTDPTVIYGMGERYKGNIRRQDLKQATAYNTYIIKGLPPTPIAMPSRAAINAVLHPAKGDSLYFVAKGDGQGTHVFSATLKAHNNAVNNANKLYRKHRKQ